MKESLDPKAWWHQAMQDLRLAQVGVKHDALGTAAAISYCCQQACEKMLKSYLLTQGWKVAKTHDLRLLANEAKKNLPVITPLLSSLSDLSADFIQSRYPFTFEKGIDEADVKRAVETAEHLRSLLEGIVLQKDVK